MNELMARWFSRLGRISGVAACGLYHMDKAISLPWEAHLTEPLLNELWQRLAHVARATVPAGETAESMRWTFDRHVVTAAARPDGSLFFLLRNKDGNTDTVGLARMENEFRNLR
jgi:hypothetical protein